MGIQLLPPERFLEVQESLRADARKATPEAVNLDPALEFVGDLPPLAWDGVEYRVRPISYPEGLQLQRIQLALQDTATDAEAIDRREAAYARACDLFGSFLNPPPVVSPFVDLHPEEVGALLGYFFALQTRRGGPSRFQTTARRPRMTT